jgi:hypothetical protein
MMNEEKKRKKEKGKEIRKKKSDAFRSALYYSTSVL